MVTKLANPELLPDYEVADIFSVSASTVRSWKKDGAPFHRDRGRVRYDPSELAAWRRETGRLSHPKATPNPELPVPFWESSKAIDRAFVLQRIGDDIGPGVTVVQLDKLAAAMTLCTVIILARHYPVELGVEGYDPEGDKLPNVTAQTESFWREIVERASSDPTIVQKLSNAWNAATFDILGAKLDGNPTKPQRTYKQRKAKR